MTTCDYSYEIFFVSGSETELESNGMLEKLKAKKILKSFFIAIEEQEDEEVQQKAETLLRSSLFVPMIFGFQTQTSSLNSKKN